MRYDRKISPNLVCMVFIKHVFAISTFCVESDWRVCGNGCFMCSSCRYQTVFTNRCLQTLMHVDDILIALFSLKNRSLFLFKSDDEKIVCSI